MCDTCGNGSRIPDNQPIQKDKHGKFRVCPNCGGSANIQNEPFKEES